MKKSAIAFASALLISSALSVTAHAGGFALEEQSIMAQGSALSGAATDITDSSTIFYNPAGLVKLNKAQAQVGQTTLYLKADYTDRGSTVTTPASGGAVATNGTDGGNPLSASVVPHAYFAIPLTEDQNIWAGLGVTVPFGLGINYGSDWAGRYDSIKSELLVADLSPTIAGKITDRISIGGGLNVQYSDASLKNAIPDPTAAAPSATTDGVASLEGEAWDIGFNVGVLVEPTDNIRLGATYRSGMTHEVDGDVTTVLPAGLGGGTLVQSAKADLKLPDSASVGMSYDVNDHWTVMARGAWHGWSNFDEIRVQFDDGTADSVLLQNYDDSYSASIGVQYHHSESLTLRGGFMYDQTPTTDAFRNTSTPDGDRYWLSFGGDYNIGDRLRLGFAAYHIIFDDAPINLNGASGITFGAPISSTGTVAGDVETDVNAVALNVSYQF